MKISNSHLIQKSRSDKMTFKAIPKFKEIDLKAWPNRFVYERYNNLKNPYLSETVKLDVTDAIKFAKEKKVPLNIIVMYAIGKAINNISQMRIRKNGTQLVEYERSCLSFPVAKRGGENQINFCEFNYDSNIDKFIETAKSEIQKAKTRQAEFPDEYRPDATYMSFIDTHYESLANPNNGTDDLIPRINWGVPQEFWTGNPMQLRSIMPLTVDINHGLGTQVQVSKVIEIIKDVFKHTKHPSESLIAKAEQKKYFSHTSTYEN